MLNTYNLIQEFYAGKYAERSGVPLINHIDEGLNVLALWSAPSVVTQAFCLHPMLQADEDLRKNLHLTRFIDGEQVALAMEYRAVANAWLSDKVRMSAAGPIFDVRPQLSCLPYVNMMLIADKVQNRADFELYHKGKHPRSAELELYFKTWLDTLAISECNYEYLVAKMKNHA